MTNTNRPELTYVAPSPPIGNDTDAQGRELLTAGAKAFGISSKAAEVFAREAEAMLLVFRAHEQQMTK